MKMLSDDDLDLQGMSDEELARAWDLWFDLAQATNDSDPAYTHGVFVNWDAEEGKFVNPASSETRRHRASRSYSG